MAMSTKEKLTKTSKSILNFVRTGGTYHSMRGTELLFRYNNLRDLAIEEGVWREWCDENNFAYGHDGYDCWA